MSPGAAVDTAALVAVVVVGVEAALGHAVLVPACHVAEVVAMAKFGEPGKMDPGLVTVLSDLQDLYAALVDEVNFPNP